jgi:hypothetical protein
MRPALAGAGSKALARAERASIAVGDAVAAPARARTASWTRPVWRVKRAASPPRASPSSSLS